MPEANDYKYLLVDLKIKPKETVVFEDKMRVLLPDMFEKPRETYGGFGWKLLFSGKRELSDHVAYQHLWQMPRDSVLADAMILAGRNTDYQILDATKLSEIQDVFRVAGVYSPENEELEEPPRVGRAALAKQHGARLFRETVKAPADWIELHDWQDAMPVIAASARAKQGLELVFAMQAETGLLRRFLNFWRPLEPEEGRSGRPQASLSAETFNVSNLENAAAGAKPLPKKYPFSELQEYVEVDYRNRPRPQDVSYAAQ